MVACPVGLLLVLSGRSRNECITVVFIPPHHTTACLRHSIVGGVLRVSTGPSPDSHAMALRVYTAPLPPTSLAHKQFVSLGSVWGWLGLVGWRSRRASHDKPTLATLSLTCACAVCLLSATNIIPGSFALLFSLSGVFFCCVVCCLVSSPGSHCRCVCVLPPPIQALAVVVATR